MRISIGILGGGSFGTALANLLSEKGHRVTLWAREKSIVDSINQTHLNPLYLNQIPLNPFQATDQLNEVCRDKELLLFAVPTQFIRSVLNQIKNKISSSTLLVNAAKGIEQKTLLTPSGIFSDLFGDSILDRFTVLSGPTFALELARKNPSGAVVASINKKAALQIQRWISLSYFRLYTGEDVLGVELGGALKNVMAIGTGIAEGLNFGLNTRAALITRCLYDMTKLGVTMGAQALTFSGLSGLGDLILTCTGELSRNRFVGMELGKGKKLKEITTSMKSIAEGVFTAESVHHLAKKYQVDMPNADYVYRILYEDLTPQQALKEILSRSLKKEMAGLDE